MIRILGAAAICSGFVLAAPTAHGRLTLGVRYSSLHQDYQRAIATIIANRMQATRYRSQFGGLAVLAIDVGRSGLVTKTSIRRTSGSPYIDTLALEAVPVGFQFSPFPDTIDVRVINVTVPLRFGARP